MPRSDDRSWWSCCGGEQLVCHAAAAARPAWDRPSTATHIGVTAGGARDPVHTASLARVPASPSVRKAPRQARGLRWRGAMPNATVRYDDAIVRKFVTATIAWGAVGMLVGLWCALELAVPRLKVAPYFTVGRLRPLHTNAVIFAFAGNAIFAAVYYSSQRLLKARPIDRLSAIHFWGWQA